MNAPMADRFILGEMFETGEGDSQRAAIVMHLLDDDGRYAELVEVPSGERFAISRRALSRDWQIRPSDGPFYVEQISNGQVDWHAEVPNLEFVIAIAKCALHRRQGETIRFRTRDYVSPQDLGRLRFLNAARLLP
jgi:hypothetical protein